MLAAAVWGSVCANSAVWAVVEGSSALAGGAPGSGGRRLKSGGITSGALVVTANSSGDFLSRPAMVRSESQPLSAVAQKLMARTVVSSLISVLLARILGLRLEHIIKDVHGAEGDRQVGYIEHIPVI